MPNKLYVICTLSLLLFSTGLLAKQPSQWYSIEYIVFENKPLGNQHLEPWANSPIEAPLNAITLDPRVDAKAFSPLRVQQQQLHGVFARLKSLSSYQPIAHGGWIQPLTDNRKKQAVHISQQTANTQLEGSIIFHKGKYLHLDIDLQFSETPSGIAYDSHPIIAATQRYRLTESRRIKTTDSNYFDHPRFGVITRVEKIDSPLMPTPTNDLLDQPQLEVDRLDQAEPNQMPAPNDH